MAKAATSAGPASSGTKKVVKKRVVKKKRSKAGGKKINKSQAIRDYAESHPEEGPTAITRALAAKGIKVSPPQVSNVLSAAGKKKGRRGKPGPKPGGSSRSAGTVNLDSLIDTQKFVEKVGGVESAERLIGALKKLQG